MRKTLYIALLCLLASSPVFGAPAASYPLKTTPTVNDKVLIIDVADGNKTKTATVESVSGTDDQTALDVPATPWGDYIGTTVQALLSEIDTALRGLISAIPTTLAGFTDDETHRLVTDAEKLAWNTKQSALTPGTDYLTPAGAASTYVPKSIQLPTAPPTNGRQIIQAVGGCSLSIYDNQADCETNGGVWTVPYSVWTSVISGLINDEGTGLDDLWSAAKLITMLAGKQNTLTPDTDYLTPATAASTYQVDLNVPDQAEAEAGTATTERVWTAQRIAQAIASLAPGGGTVDLTAPGPIGSVTPNTGAFTTLTAASFDTSAPASGETGEIGLQEDPTNGTNTITLKAPPSLASDVILTLPSGAAPAAASDTCTAGQWWFASGYFYMCVATNTWQRAPLASW